LLQRAEVSSAANQWLHNLTEKLYIKFGESCK
jgi:hypothetical protein